MKGRAPSTATKPTAAVARDLDAPPRRRRRAPIRPNDKAPLGTRLRGRRTDPNPTLRDRRVRTDRREREAPPQSPAQEHEWEVQGIELFFEREGPEWPVTDMPARARKILGEESERGNIECELAVARNPNLSANDCGPVWCANTTVRNSVMRHG